MKGETDYDLLNRCFRIAIFDEKTAVTMTFTTHPAERDRPLPVTEMRKGPETTAILKGLAEALMQLGIMPENGTTAELRATKAHLDDMRRLAMKEKYNVR